MSQDPGTLPYETDAALGRTTSVSIFGNQKSYQGLSQAKLEHEVRGPALERTGVPHPEST